MASDHRGNLTALTLLFLLLVTSHLSSAQPPPSSNGKNNNKNDTYFPNTNFNPSMAIVIIALISAFFFLGFFSIYIRQCADGRLNPRLSPAAATSSTAAAARSRRQRGLDPDLLQTFPTLVYSEVKLLKIGKGSLECAVCLNEFDDDETLRLLPKCSHVFHPDCIDAWLASHVTCPVCRSNLSDATSAAVDDGDDHLHHQETVDPTVEIQDREVRVEIDGEEEETKTEMENLERFVNMKRARSRARPEMVMLPRSHSTGHSLVQPGQNLDRFTLRLPEDIRKEIVAAGTLKRATSLVAFREGRSMGRAGRSVRLGQSGRWGSLLSRTLSVKNWGRTRSKGAEPEQVVRSGSVKGGRFNAPLDGGKSSGENSESSTAALNRV